jgi:hypothetical protein
MDTVVAARHDDMVYEFHAQRGERFSISRVAHSFSLRQGVAAEMVLREDDAAGPHPTSSAIQTRVSPRRVYKRPG